MQPFQVSVKPEKLFSPVSIGAPGRVPGRAVGYTSVFNVRNGISQWIGDKRASKALRNSDTLNAFLFRDQHDETK